MYKKVLVTAILLGLFVAGSLIADEGQVGLYLTVLSAYNSEPYQNQLVYATINDVTQDKYTNSSGLAKYGWKSSSGIYYIETEINGETYTTTVEKIAGVIANRTWYIQEIKHDPE